MAISLINTECKRYGCMKNLLACYANCKYNTRCEELRSEVMPIVTLAANDINSYRQERGLSPIEIQMTRRGLKFIDGVSLQKKSLPGKKIIHQKARLVRAKPAAGTRSEQSDKKSPTPKAALNGEIFKSEIRMNKAEANRKILKGTASAKKTGNKSPSSFAPALKAAEKSEIERLPYKSAPKPVKRRKRLRPKIKLRMETPAKMSRRAKDGQTATSNEGLERTGAESTTLSTATKTAERNAAQGKKKVGKESAAKKKKKMYIILDGNNSALVDERGLMAKLLAGVSPNARYFEATEIELRLQVAYKK